MVEAAVTLRNRILADPQSTSGHKKKAQENVEKLQNVQFEILHDNSESFRVTVAGIGSKNPGE